MRVRACLLASSFIALAMLPACRREAAPPAARPASAQLPGSCPDRTTDDGVSEVVLRADEASIEYANVASVSLQQAQAAIVDANENVAGVEALEPDAAAPALQQASLQLAEVAAAHRRYEAAMKLARDALAAMREPAATIAAKRTAAGACNDGAGAAYEGLRSAFDERLANLDESFRTAEEAGKSLATRQSAAEDSLAGALANARRAGRLQ